MQKTAHFCGLNAYECETVVVGSGASGLNAFDLLLDGANSRVVLVTEELCGGTSRNTGSDKQTYYKLSLSGSDPDSVHALAGDLFRGGCVDGDLALCEAALSAQGFLKLVQLGVPFPKNRYGEYIGYKTDHDPHRRATSAGPYTSKYMTEALHRSVEGKGGTILDRTMVVRILTCGNEVKGVLCLDTEEYSLQIIWCRYLVWATGGPAAIYENSVYPTSQHGSSGIAFEAGCIGQNLTEWQYGLASTNPRWNVSGTFMQALPRFFSKDKHGVEHDFLLQRLPDRNEMLSFIFLKGYQWPFDVSKVPSGSSIIDLIVLEELRKGRTVYLDYRRNPIEEIQYHELAVEAGTYLEKAGATFGLPIDRLRLMNEPAYEFYREHGIDLATEALEISLCAQHNNGGLAVDHWYRSSVQGMFAIGEAAGTHGVHRPGGSALNAGQVGSARAAAFILAMREKEPWQPDPCPTEQVTELLALIRQVIGDADTVSKLLAEQQRRMSLVASAVRRPQEISVLKQETAHILKTIGSLRIDSASMLPTFFRFRDTLISQLVYLHAFEDYCMQNGGSRGSALYITENGAQVHPCLPKEYTSHFDSTSTESLIQQVAYQNQLLETAWRPARPIPQEDDFFENVWRGFRQHANVY